MKINRTNAVWEFPGFIVFHQLLVTRTWWNEELVDEFLSVPDRIEINPHNPDQRMRLFLSERVYEIEKTSQFKKRVLELNCDKIKPSQFFHHLQKLQNKENKKIRLRLKKERNGKP